MKNEKLSYRKLNTVEIALQLMHSDLNNIFDETFKGEKR